MSDDVHIDERGTIHANINGVRVRSCKQVVVVVFVLNCHGNGQFGILDGIMSWPLERHWWQKVLVLTIEVHGCR